MYIYLHIHININNQKNSKHAIILSKKNCEVITRNSVKTASKLNQNHL